MESILEDDILISDKLIFDNEPIVEVSCGLIGNDNGILMLYRAGSDEQPSTWSIPGGRAELGETPSDALRREMSEEIGHANLTVSESPQKSYYVSFDKHYYKLHLFELNANQIKTEEIKLNPDEHTDYRFFNLDELENIPMIMGQNVILKDYFRKSKSNL